MNEKIKKITIICVICVLFVLLCYSAVYFIIGTRKDIHDNGYRANAVRNELTNAQTAQREETRVIDDTAESIARSQKGIDESERTNREITSVERKDAEIITECQQILKRVRERNSSKD